MVEDGRSVSSSSSSSSSSLINCRRFRLWPPSVVRYASERHPTARECPSFLPSSTATPISSPADPSAPRALQRRSAITGRTCHISLPEIIYQSLKKLSRPHTRCARGLAVIAQCGRPIYEIVAAKANKSPWRRCSFGAEIGYDFLIIRRRR